MLVDDNKDDNFFHERVIRKSGFVNVVVPMQSGIDALEYLKNRYNHVEPHPDLIFLDINMPRMNGWEFLEEYNNLDKEFQSAVIVVMLTTSDSPEDRAKAALFNMVSGLKSKPLTIEMLEEIIKEYFQG